MAKVLPIILAAIVALIIGGAAAWFLKPEPVPEVVAAPPVENEHHEEHLNEHLIKERIVTLADPGAKRFLKLTIALMWRDLAATPTAKADGGDGEQNAADNTERGSARDLHVCPHVVRSARIRASRGH